MYSCYTQTRNCLSTKKNNRGTHFIASAENQAEGRAAMTIMSIRWVLSVALVASGTAKWSWSWDTLCSDGHSCAFMKTCCGSTCCKMMETCSQDQLCCPMLHSPCGGSCCPSGQCAGDSSSGSCCAHDTIPSGGTCVKATCENKLNACHASGEIHKAMVDDVAIWCVRVGLCGD